MSLIANIIVQGQKYSIWEIKNNNVSEFQLFFKELRQQERNNLIKKIVYIADHGPPRNEQKFRHEEDGIYAIKYNQIRIYCFFDHDKMIVLTHGFIKKRQKADPNQLTKAKKIKAQYEKVKSNTTMEDNANGNIRVV